MNEHPSQEENDDPEPFKELDRLLVSMQLNSALVNLKAGNARAAIKICSDLLESSIITEADKPKTYYRRGQAYGKVREDELAIEDLKKALAYTPNDAGVIAELNAAKARLKARREKEKAVYAKLFS